MGSKFSRIKFSHSNLTLDDNQVISSSHLRDVAIYFPSSGFNIQIFIDQIFFCSLRSFYLKKHSAATEALCKWRNADS